MRMRSAWVLGLVVVGVLGGQAAAKSRQLVVSLERTGCFGECPVYQVSIFDDGLVRWKGKQYVGRTGAARGKADPAKLAALIDAFGKARFMEMDRSGQIPQPLPPGSRRTIELDCTDTSHAIMTFRKGPGKKGSHTLDDAHCKGDNALTELEHLVDEVAGSQGFIEAAADAKPGKLACEGDEDCTVSCGQGAVNRDWYRVWVAAHADCKDGCAGKGMGARCVKQRCVAFRGSSRDDGCTARP